MKLKYRLYLIRNLPFPWMNQYVEVWRFLQLDELADAEDALSEANILNNEDSEVWGYLSMVCLRTGRQLEAEQAYKYALKVCTTSNLIIILAKVVHVTWLYSDRGSILIAAGRTDHYFGHDQYNASIYMMPRSVHYARMTVMWRWQCYHWLWTGKGHAVTRGLCFDLVGGSDKGSNQNQFPLSWIWPVCWHLSLFLKDSNWSKHI